MVFWDYWYWNGFCFAEINDTFHINLQTTYANGTIQSGTFTFAFNITENSDASCLGPIVYNHTKTNATDSRGIVSLYLPTVGSAGGNLSNLDYNKQYYLCYYRDGVLKDVSQLGRVPYSFRATEVNLSDVSIDSNLTLGSFNISASSGFFTFLGSLANRISNLFAVDVNVSRNLTIGGNLSVNGTTLFVNSNTSKVGMGTGTPEEALDVIGTIQATVPFQTTGSEIIYAGNPLGEVKFYRPASTSDIALYAGAIERLRINGSFGFVGINTTTPKNTLNVFGDINATGTVYSNNLNLTKAYVWVTNGTFLQSGSWNATNESYVPYIGANRNINLGNNNFTVNGSALFVNTNNSKVGVGTTNPAEALDVVGTIQATGPFQTTGSEILYAGNPLGEVKFYSTS